MSRRLTNKQVVVLELLRAEGELTAKEIAAEITERTVCSVCDGTGNGDWGRRHECEKCYGSGRAYFHYSDAYQALQALRKVGAVARRCKRDEWGDELALHVYYAVDVDAKDELEQAWNLPAATEVHR